MAFWPLTSRLSVEQDFNKKSFHNYLSMIIEAVWWHTPVDTVFQPFTVGCFIGRPIFHFCRLYRNFGGKAGTHFVSDYHDQICMWDKINTKRSEILKSISLGYGIFKEITKSDFWDFFLIWFWNSWSSSIKSIFIIYTKLKKTFIEDLTGIWKNFMKYIIFQKLSVINWNLLSRYDQNLSYCRIMEYVASV